MLITDTAVRDPARGEFLDKIAKRVADIPVSQFVQAERHRAFAQHAGGLQQDLNLILAQGAPSVTTLNVAQSATIELLATRLSR